MEANVVDAPVFVDLKDPLPVGDVSRRITCQWKIAAVMCPAEIDATAV